MTALGAQQDERAVVDLLLEYDQAVAPSGRESAVLEAISASRFTPQALRLTKSGAPSHPLYLPGDLIPGPFLSGRHTERTRPTVAAERCSQGVLALDEAR